MIQDKILSYAASFLGRQYSTDLSVAPAFRRMLTTVGAPPGADVCAAFVYHVIANVCAMANRQCPILATAHPYVMYLHAFANSYKVATPYYATNKPIATIDLGKVLCTPMILRAGDVFILHTENGNYHMGFVKTVSSHFITTIETAGSRVIEKRRYFNVLHRIIRIC